MKGRNEKNSKGLADDPPADRLRFLLDKVEWDESDMTWMLSYLNQSDDHGLREILLEAFKRHASSLPPREDGFDQKGILDQLHKKLFG